MIIKELQAFRVIALVLVFLYHLRIPFFQLGYLGVDIFFIISGVIFSKILLKRFESNTFNFKIFLKKRIFRILPSLLIVLFLVSLISWMFFPPNELKIFGASLFSSSTFTSNIFFYLINNDYFALDNYVLKHLWSLSIEIQFYLIYPLILFISKNLIKSKSYDSYVLTFLFYVSLILTIFYQKNSILTFYLIIFRLWEFLFGYFIYCQIIKQFKNNYNLYLVIFTLVFYLIFGEYALVKKQIIVCLSFYFIFYISYNKKNFISSILKSAFLQNIANKSYLIFLIHFPVIHFIYYFEFSNNIAALICLSIFLTYIFLKLIIKLEKFLLGNLNKIKLSLRKIRYLLFFLILITIIGLFFYKSEGILYRVHFNKELPNNYFALLKDSERSYCKNLCKKKDFNNIKFLLYGDSHASDFQSSLDTFTKKNKKDIFFQYAYEDKTTLYGQLGRLNDLLLENTYETIFIIHHVYMSDHEKYLKTLLGIIDKYPKSNFYYFKPRIEFTTSPVKNRLLNKKLKNLKTLPLNNEKLLNKISTIKNKNFNFIDQNKIFLRLINNCNNIYVCFDGHDLKNRPLYYDNHHLTNYGAEQVLIEILKEYKF